MFLGGALLNEFPRVHQMIADLLERVASGELRVVIDKTCPLAEAAPVIRIPGVAPFLGHFHGF